MNKQGKYALQMIRQFWVILDWIYPPQCGGCDARNSRWCSSCQEKTRVIGENICHKCGVILKHPGICEVCKHTTPTFRQLRSWAIYQNPLRNAIHRIKYKRDIAMADIFSKQLISLICKQDWMLDTVVPVPLSIARLAERGYNQSALLARPISFALGYNYLPGSIKRIRDTKSQVALSLQQRIDNVAGAFDADVSMVSGKNILLVDDVATSGATLEACSHALCAAGANNVYAVTLARAI